VVAGTGNIAYGAAKADQAHQVRLLATELGPLGVRVNGVNPDGVVRGSGIFEGDWGDERARVYGVSREELGRFYAGRTVLGHEVLPEHVAAAVFALCAGDLALTTGTIVPVDSGVPMAFLR
jgi:NAD(P)-dependent dehydrogenase (short-subunit alcohol dehydrogenase family)